MGMGLITLCNKMRTCEQQFVSDGIYIGFVGTRKWTGALEYEKNDVFGVISA